MRYNSFQFSNVSAATSRKFRSSISGAHALAARIKRGLRQSMRLVALPDDFDLESRIGFGQRGGHEAQRQGVVDAVSVCTRGDPAHGLAVVPDRLIADGVRIGRSALE